ncbi:MAG: hypothetical protein PVI57_17205, partial [Gemmatimonadota bacterium]
MRGAPERREDSGGEDPPAPEGRDPGASFAALARDLEGLFARGVRAALEDDAFDRWALRVFRHQF